MTITCNLSGLFEYDQKKDFKHSVIEIWPKHAKNVFYFNLYHFFSLPLSVE